MLLPFDSFDEFITSVGCSEHVRDLFDIDPGYEALLMLVNQRFNAIVFRRMQGKEEVPHGLCLPTLVRLYTSLLDEVAPPTTTAQLIYTSFIMGRMVEIIDGYREANKTQPAWTTHPN